MSLTETTAAARDTGVLAGALAFIVGVVKALAALHGWISKAKAAAEAKAKAEEAEAKARAVEAEAKAKAREERAALEARRDAEAKAHRDKVETALGSHGEQLGKLADKVDGLSDDVSHVRGRLDAHDAHRTSGLRVIGGAE